MHKAENKDIPIVRQAEVVKSGVVRVMEQQEKGWSYVSEALDPEIGLQCP
jgi:intracellular sulfur oxidation DsrE/DsrF family protein